VWVFSAMHPMRYRSLQNLWLLEVVVELDESEFAAVHAPFHFHHSCLYAAPLEVDYAENLVELEWVALAAAKLHHSSQTSAVWMAAERSVVASAKYLVVLQLCCLLQTSVVQIVTVVAPLGWR
jgi:hypothetical protein